MKSDLQVPAYIHACGRLHSPWQKRNLPLPRLQMDSKHLKHSSATHYALLLQFDGGQRTTYLHMQHGERATSRDTVM